MIRKILSINHIEDSPFLIQELSVFDTLTDQPGAILIRGRVRTRLILEAPGMRAAHSDLRLFTGFARAALIAWKLIVARAIIIASNPAATKIQGLSAIR